MVNAEFSLPFIFRMPSFRGIFQGKASVYNVRNYSIAYYRKKESLTIPAVVQYFSNRSCTRRTGKCNQRIYAHARKGNKNTIFRSTHYHLDPHDDEQKIKIDAFSLIDEWKNFVILEF